MAIDDACKRSLYRDMLRIRRVEEAIAARYGEHEMRCPVHLSEGQEAVAVGVCQALRLTDQVVSTHRCHGHYLAKGGDLKAMLAEIYCRAPGCTGGRGGSMHLMDPSVGMTLSLPIVSTTVPVGVGIAFAAKRTGRDDVAVVFFGDAAVEEGAFHESANFAALHRLPVIFVCENNRLSFYTALEDRQPDRPISRLASAHDVAVSECDGNDVMSVLAEASTAVDRARDGDGPTFLLCNTRRWREHCGPRYDWEVGAMTAAEFEALRLDCPIDRLAGELRAANSLSDRDVAALDAELAAEIDAAFEFARSAPWPAAESAVAFVYA